MPDDPMKLLSVAAKLNGLRSSDIPPWHLKVTFTLFDADGNSTDHGTYEEFWVSQSKHRFDFVSGAYTSSLYHNNKSIRLTGSHAPLPDLLVKLREDFVFPIVDKDLLPNAALSPRERNAGAALLTCVVVDFKSSKNLSLQMQSSTECFDSDRPALRVVDDAWSMRVVNKSLMTFHAHYVPIDIQVGEAGRTELTAHLEKIEDLGQENPADFSAPAGAFAQPGKGILYLTKEVAKEQQIRRAEPAYPAAALVEQITGSVHVRALIGEDGHVYNLRAIDGPPMLRQAAVDAVSKYAFRPYWLNGELFEVLTVFQVDFQLPTTKK